MRPRIAIPLALTALTFIPALSPQATARSAEAEPRTPEDVLARAARAYRDVPALRDTFTFTVETPGKPDEARTLEYGFALGGAVYFDLQEGAFRVVARDGLIRAVTSRVDDRYVEAPYGGDFGAALTAIGAREGAIPEMPQIALRQGKGLDAVLDALRLEILGPLEIAGLERVEGRGGTGLHEIELRSDNGVCRARFDAASGYLVELELTVHPPGAPGEPGVRMAGTFDPRTPENPAALFQVETAGREPVNHLSRLGGGFPTGAPAPDVTLPALGGGTVRLADLQGRVVVLDFWASWCVPCWKGLAEVQKLADWAAASEKPVTVYPVNIAETGETAAERRERAARFWRSRGFAMDTLLDLEGTLAAALDPGVPATVLIAPDGTLAVYHSGVLPDMAERLRTEVLELLAPGEGGDREEGEGW